MVARSGWDQGMSSNEVVAEIKIGTYNFVNHQHLDAGSFQVYYKGPLAVQSGIYQGTTGGYGSAHFKNYSQRTIAHNSMLIYDPKEKFYWHNQEIINDGGQRYPNGGEEPLNLDDLLNNGYKTGNVLAHAFGPDTIQPEYTYIKGELADAYTSKVKSFKRSFVFLNLKESENPAALIVFDWVEAADKKYKKNWLMHCVQEPEIAANIAKIKRTEKGYDGQIINTTLLPASENLTVKKIGGRDNEFIVNDINFPQQFISENNSGDNASWRLEVSPVKESKCDSFLNVMEIGDYREGSTKTSRAIKVETKTMIGTRLFERVVLFSKNSSLINEPIVLENESMGISKVLITDLENGMWQITNIDDKKSIVTIVKCDKNIIYFLLKKGTYKIQKLSN